MRKASGTNAASNFPEFAVRRETISRFFEPPLPRSTFHDLVNKGKIVPVKGIRGFYLLNESLRRLGLRQVPELPKEVPNRSMEDIMRLAFFFIDPEASPLPPWAACEDVLHCRDIDHARRIASEHLDAVAGLLTLQEKMAYMSGVLDALYELKSPGRGI